MQAAVHKCSTDQLFFLKNFATAAKWGFSQGATGAASKCTLVPLEPDG